MLEGEAEDEDRDGHDGGGEPDDDQAGFGLDVAGVSAHVVVADRIMEPVAYDRTNDGADYWGEVEESWRNVKDFLLAWDKVESERKDVPRL